MPHSPANAAPLLRYAVPPLSAALLAMASATALSQTAPSEPLKSCDTGLDACRAPAADETPWLRLKLDRLMSEKWPVSRETTPTYARAQRIEGTVDERIVLEGNAEIRRGGTVVRGDRITYTQATDQVDVEGNARIFGRGSHLLGAIADVQSRCADRLDAGRRIHLCRA